MFTKIGHTPGFVHTFTSEKDFLPQDDWVFKYKGKEVYDSWKLLIENDSYEHPDVVALYEEWIADEAITHTTAPE
jgi:hypothetical protein